MSRKETGSLGEKLARNFLSKRGYRVLETNYRCPQGEIDIVASHKGALVFIEVRTKRGLEFGSPEESITPSKKEKMRVTALHYLQAHENVPETWRIDMVAVELDRTGKLLRIDLVENAVTD